MVKQTNSEKDALVLANLVAVKRKRQVIKKILRKVALDAISYSDEALQEGRYDILIEEMVPSEVLDDTKKLGIEELSDN